MLCDKYGLDYDKSYSRWKLGWSLEEILEIVPCTDHRGKEYESMEKMCEAYSVEVETFKKRIQDGFTKEKALTYVNPDTTVTDHNGTEYSSRLEMCKAYNIDYSTFRERLEAGMTLRAALTCPVAYHERFFVKDHEGNVFHNISEMCQHWGISRNVYDTRKKKGWTIQKILTTPINYKNDVTVDPFTKEVFPSFRSLCKKYGIQPRTVKCRMKKMSFAEALTAPVQPRVFRTWMNPEPTN